MVRNANCKIRNQLEHKQQRFVNAKTFQQHVTNNKLESRLGVRVYVCPSGSVCAWNCWHARLAWEITSCATNFCLVIICFLLLFFASCFLFATFDVSRLKKQSARRRERERDRYGQRCVWLLFFRLLNGGRKQQQQAKAATVALCNKNKMSAEW